jgi:uncharacterized protein (UPF0305 family)
VKLGVLHKNPIFKHTHRRYKMFNTATYAVIDGVSDFKKKFVENTVQHEGIKNALNGFIDTQTKYTKAAADAGMQSAMALGMIFTSKDFYTQLADQYKAMVPAFNTTKAKAK